MAQTQVRSDLPSLPAIAAYRQQPIQYLLKQPISAHLRAIHGLQVQGASRISHLLCPLAMTTALVVPLAEHIAWDILQASHRTAQHGLKNIPL